MLNFYFQFDLNATLVGLIFLLMSAFYAISSPIWGWAADRMVSVEFFGFVILLLRSFSSNVFVLW